jgi:hypothetical protein
VNISKHQIDGYPVWVIKNALSKQVCLDWFEFYQQEATFAIGSIESDDNKQVTWVSGNTGETMDRVFGDNPYLPLWNTEQGTEFTDQHKHRCHVNLTTDQNSFVGHRDVEEEIEKPGLVTLWFGNPGWQTEWQGGFYLGEGDQLYVPNEFNTQIMFPHQLWHRIQEVSEPHQLRLTVYVGYCDTDKRAFLPTHMHNQWSRDPRNNRRIKRQLRLQYGVSKPDEWQTLL